MKEDILKEIEYMIKKQDKVLDLTGSKDINSHLIALGQIMALNSIKYSMEHNDYLYKKEEEARNNDKSK